MRSSHLSSSTVASLLLLLLSTSLIQCDIYMHNPRGSNNRNCERNEDRNNDKRLFNSQNNDRGGYACPRAVSVDETIQGRMYYYAGSQLPIEWTNQHGCGNPNVKCQIILQYMCDDTAPGLRDGTPTNLNDAATNTIPDTAAGANNTNFGQHEIRDYYGDCKTRERNKGLYTADRTLQGTSAIYTRQNNNGDRHGYECPEERDYYPYWHPTPWKDIAVLTDDVTNDCPIYTAESQNVKEKGYCQYANGPAKGTGPRATSWYNNPVSCQSIDPLRTDTDKNKNQTWTTQASWGLAAPQCLANPYSRSNHLGNVAGAQAGGATALPNRYLWTVPEDFRDSCVIRIRYNISSTDFSANITAKYNDVYAPLKQDPYVTVADDVMLALAVNTNQVGRVFQDRSYVFSIKRKPSSVGSATIHNLNVRGKRGNIVQVYPAVEYDFVPNLLAVPPGDYIHFQWTGSDYNPRRGPNDAEGGPPDAADNDTNQNARADRSNFVETAFVGLNVPYNQNTITGMSMFPDTATRIKMAFIKQDMTQCFNLTQLNALNANTRETHPQNCAKLNAAKSPYFDGGLVQMKAQGYYYYQSTRNNNFSNRDQKGIIAVTTDTANAFTNINSLQERTFAYSPADRTSFSYVAVAAAAALLVVFVLTS